MTRQESFKRRVRDRMSKTGERYGAARRALIEKADTGRGWVAEPGMSDEKVRAATGKGWDEWCDLIEAWPGHDDGHAAVAEHLHEVHGVPPWWTQMVTVGFERITGRRLPNQMMDGTFTASRSRTVEGDAEAFRSMLLDPDDRLDLFPGSETELRSRPGAKSVRIGIGPGVALFTIDPIGDGRVRLTVTHERLPTIDDLEEWRAYWGVWLTAVEEAASRT
jgi:hypothetical protein